MRQIRVSSLFRRNSRVPYVRLCGHWLARLGFARGAAMLVTTAPGRIVLEPLEGVHQQAEKERKL